MKVLSQYQMIRYIITYYFLSSFAALLALEMCDASGKSNVKTQMLVQNIRTHLAQKADEIVKKRECESGLILCKNLKSKDEERGKKNSSPLKLARGQYKSIIRLNPKDVIQTFMPKARKSLYRKFQKAGESKKHWGFFHSPDIKKISKQNEKLEKETFRQGDTHLQDVKKSLVPPQKLITDERILQKSTAPKSKKDVTSTLKKAFKVEEKTALKKIKRLVKPEKKIKKVQKSKTKVTLKAEEGKPRAEIFDFLSGGFVFVLDSDNAQRNLCKKHSQIYLKQLKKYEIWALMMYDASAKLASGILQGNTNQYGDFDECLSINAVLKKPKNKWKGSLGIKGKYCLANIDVGTNSETKGLRLGHERAEGLRFIKSTIYDPGHFIPRFSTINWGLCVPSACLAEDVEKFLKSRFEVFSNASGLVFDVKVDEENCVVKDDLKFIFYTGKLVTIMFYLFVLIISLYATCLDINAEKYKLPENEKLERKILEDTTDKYTQISGLNDDKFSFKEKGHCIIMAFSLKKNLKKLLSDKNKGNIECVHGIKSLFTLLLYFAHKTIPLGMTAFSNRVVLTKISNQPITVLLRASIVYTDSFLLISGMLTSFNFAKDLSEKKEISWIKKSVARFIRLTPPLLAILLFYAYIWDQLGSGPLWNLIVKRNSLLCQRYMWRNLIYIQNLFEFEDMCAPQTHQLALDMQLSLLGPIFVNLIHSYDKVGIGILQALFILSSIMRYTSTSNNNLSVIIYHGMPIPQLYKTANLLYTQTFHRASPYILGIVVGYHLNKFEKQIKMNKTLVALGWITAISFGFYSLASPARLALRTYQYDVQEAAQYAALSPVAWSLALSWTVVACHGGLGGDELVEVFLSKSLFVFSRISYSVYLTQFLVFFYKVGVKKIPEMFTLTGSISVFEFISVMAVSVIVTLFFDIPMMEIKKIILNEKTVKTVPQGLSNLSKIIQKEDERGSDIIKDENDQETLDELKAGTDEDQDEMEEDIDDYTGSNEDISEGTDDESDEINDSEIRSLKHFIKESSEKDVFE